MNANGTEPHPELEVITFILPTHVATGEVTELKGMLAKS